MRKEASILKPKRKYVNKLEIESVERGLRRKQTNEGDISIITLKRERNTLSNNMSINNETSLRNNAESILTKTRMVGNFNN
jgi:hypothetical protein